MKLATTNNQDQSIKTTFNIKPYIKDELDHCIEKNKKSDFINMVLEQALKVIKAENIYSKTNKISRTKTKIPSKKLIEQLRKERINHLIKETQLNKICY